MTGLVTELANDWQMPSTPQPTTPRTTSMSSRSAACVWADLFEMHSRPRLLLIGFVRFTRFVRPAGVGILTVHLVSRFHLLSTLTR